MSDGTTRPYHLLNIPMLKVKGVKDDGEGLV